MNHPNPNDLEQRLSFATATASATNADREGQEQGQYPPADGPPTNGGPIVHHSNGGGGEGQEAATEEPFRGIFGSVLASFESAADPGGEEEGEGRGFGGAEADTDNNDPEDYEDAYAPGNNPVDRFLDLHARLSLPNNNNGSSLDEKEASSHNKFINNVAAPCKACGKFITQFTDGIFCANAFGSRTTSSRSGAVQLPCCGGVWCGSCYTIDNTDNNNGNNGSEQVQDEFPSFRGDDTDQHHDNATATATTTLNSYQSARNGHHLLTPFQCESCHFENIQDRSPNLSCQKDRALLRAIQRANLDAFWGSSSNNNDDNDDNDSVAENARAFAQYLEDASYFGVAIPLPPSFPVRDIMGMCHTVMCLARTLVLDSEHEVVEIEGNNAKTNENDSNKAISSTHNNTNMKERYQQALACRNAVRNYHDTTVASMTQGQACPVDSPWFLHFWQGMHLRMFGTLLSSLSSTNT